jgi:hypothetical protein
VVRACLSRDKPGSSLAVVIRVSAREVLIATAMENLRVQILERSSSIDPYFSMIDALLRSCERRIALDGELPHSLQRLVETAFEGFVRTFDSLVRTLRPEQATQLGTQVQAAVRTLDTIRRRGNLEHVAIEDGWLRLRADGTCHVVDSWQLPTRDGWLQIGCGTTRCALLNSDGDLYVLDKGQPPRKIGVIAYPSAALAISRDEEHIASTSGRATVVVFDIHGGDPRTMFFGSRNRIWSVFWATDTNELVVSGVIDGLAEVLRIAKDGTQSAIYGSSHRWFDADEFSGDGTRLYGLARDYSTSFSLIEPSQPRDELRSVNGFKKF